MKTIVGSLIILFAAHTAQAAVVVSQALDAAAPGEFSNLGSSNNQQVADDFTLTQTTILNSVSWYGRYNGPLDSVPTPTDFSIRFFDDNGKTPQTLPFQTLSISAIPVDSGSSYTPDESTSIPWYFYTAALPTLSLAADTYWLSILENDPDTGAAGSTQWLWADSDSTGLRSNRVGDSVAWVTATDIDHAFSLNGSEVPVPAALWLFGSGLLGLVVMARRKKA